MSLDWELGNIADYENKCFFIADHDSKQWLHEYDKGDRVLRGLTKTLIMISPALGFREITEKNAKKVYARLKVLEKLSGALCAAPGGGDYFFTAQDIRDHIGLRVNVTETTDAEWSKNILMQRLHDAAYDFERSSR